MSRNGKVSEMEMMNAELDKVTLTRQQQKEAASEVAEGGVKALKVIEIQGGKRPNCIRRFWDWLRA